MVMDATAIVMCRDNSLPLRIFNLHNKGDLLRIMHGDEVGTVVDNGGFGMIKEILEDAKLRMGKSVESLRLELQKLRTGRAHTSLLDHITVEYYGAEVPLSQVANVNVEDARTLTVAPWEKPMVQVIEKAIMTSDLGLNPVTAGMLIRVPLPPLTEERRKDMIRVVRHEAENGRVAIRNIRRDALGNLKELLEGEGDLRGRRTACSRQRTETDGQFRRRRG